MLKSIRYPSVLVDRRLYSRQCTLPAMKVNSISNNRDVICVIISLYLAPIRQHPLWALQYKKHMDKWEQVKWMPTKMVRGLKHFPCEERLSKLGLPEPKEVAFRGTNSSPPLHRENNPAGSRLPREVVQSPSLEVLKMQWEKPWATQPEFNTVTAFRRLASWTSQGPFQPE